MRGRICLMLAVVLAMMGIAACGGNETKGESANQQEAGNVTDSGDTTASGNGEAPYELVVELLTYGSTPDDLKTVEEAVNQVILPEINCTIKFLPIAVADHATKVNLIATSGEKVDLIMTGITSNAASLYSNGVLMGIGELMEQYAPELIELQGPLLEVGRFDGDVYSVPGLLYPGETLNLLYNKAMAEEYGIHIPDQIDSYEAWDAFLAEAASKLPENVYAFTLGDGAGASTLNWDSEYDSMGDTSNLSYGVLTDVENGEVISNWYTSDKYELLVEKRREWYEAGYCVPDSMTSGYSTVDCISAGICFAFQNGFTASCNEVTLSQTSGVELGHIPLSEAVISTSSTSLMSWGVPVTSENPQKAVEFLNMMFTNETLMNLLNYGIEGQHYVKVSERIIDYPEGISPLNCGWGGFINWFGDNAVAFQFAPMTEAYYEELENYSIDKAVVSNALGYSFDTSTVKTELAAISTVIDTHKPSLECGLVNVEERLPVFIEALEKAGINKVIDENQKQYSEWLNQK